MIVARGTAYVRAAGGGAAAARVRPSATGMRMRQSYMGPMMNVRRATSISENERGEKDTTRKHLDSPP